MRYLRHSREAASSGPLESRLGAQEQAVIVPTKKVGLRVTRLPVRPFTQLPIPSRPMLEIGLGLNGKGIPLGFVMLKLGQSFSHFAFLFYSPSLLPPGVGHVPSFIVSYKTLEFGCRLNPFISVLSKTISPTSNAQRLEFSFTQKLDLVLLN